MNFKTDELTPIYENVKSYYKKAKIKKYYNKDGIINKIELISYNTSIASIEDFKLKLNNNKKVYSTTTLRHLKEFVKQYYYILETNYKNLYNNLTKKSILELI